MKICITDGCDRVSLTNGKGYCATCYSRFLEQRQVDQNDQMIALLTSLNNNISNLAVKIENIETKQIIIENKSTEQINKINQVNKKIDEMFIPSIEFNKDTDSSHITKTKIKTSSRNLSALANKLDNIK